MEADRLIDLVTFNKIKPALNQIETNLYCQRKEEHQWLEKYGVAHQAYAPLGQGQANQMFDEESVKTIAAAHGKTAAQVLLRFQIQNGVAIIPKSVHVERMQENIEVFDFYLSDMEMTQLAALDTGKPMTGDPENPDKVEFAMTW